MYPTINNQNLEKILNEIIISQESLTSKEQENFSESDWKYAIKYNDKINEFLNYVLTNSRKKTRKKTLNQAEKYLNHFKKYIGIYKKGKIQISLLKKYYIN